MAVVGMAANPSGAHQAGRNMAGQDGWSVPSMLIRLGTPIPPIVGGSGHGARRFTTPTDSVAAARSNVAPEMFRAITRTVLLVREKAAGQRRRRFVALQQRVYVQITITWPPPTPLTATFAPERMTSTATWPKRALPLLAGSASCTISTVACPNRPAVAAMSALSRTTSTPKWPNRAVPGPTSGKTATG